MYFYLEGQRAWEDEQDQLRIERNALEDRRWMKVGTAQQIAINIAHLLHDQERRQRDLEAGRDYQEYVPWTYYATIRQQPEAVQASVH
ncbi:hypothetical protein Hanom_Chr15g01341781 [Helianthus anomalus]